MLDAFLLHHRETPNIGDLACSPADYFSFGTSQTAAFGAKTPQTRRLIMGGGQVWKSCIRTVRTRAQGARHKIIWGVGISRFATRQAEFAEMREACTLIGTRCAGIETEGARYVPCVSAMSEHFDSAPEPRHEAVLFSHAKYSDAIWRTEGLPEMSNHGPSLKEAIHFIASGETVVTSSYHGTYWALLLGRRVICIPFSEKFKFFAQPPTMASPEDWPLYLGKAARADGALEEARALNRAFYDDVMNL